MTATLSYDSLNRMVQWSAGSTGQQQYVYDASGQRVLSRTTSGGASSLTVYAFGLQELHYHGDGTPVGGTSNCYSSSLGGQLLGKFDGTNTSFFLLDGRLGSVVASFSSTAGSAGVLGNQSYEPYGKSQYQQGSLGTSKGYTGQDADSLSGLDYYHARSYDPIAGIFLSPDSVQGNAAGMNPYAYVAGNPETATDPTGQYVITSTGAGGSTPSLLDPNNPLTWPRYEPKAPQPRPQPNPPPEEDPSLPGIGFFCPCAPDIQHVLLDHLGRGEDKPGYSPANDNSGLRFALNSAYGFDPANREAGHSPIPVVAFIRWDVSKDMFPPPPPDECSFTSSTKVATVQGETAIGDLQVGDKVLAYNPTTHKMDLEPILHVWKHTDSDLIDLTHTIETPAHDGKPASTESETIHTTSEHPFLTQDQGFTAAGKLNVGTRLLRAEGSVGIVTGWKMVKATSVMYNLEVAQDHTFVVGDGQWVVHNQCNPTQLGNRLVAAGSGPWNNGQNPHHIIPCALMNHPLFQASGLDINAAVNGRFLWDSNHRMEALNAGEPYHANSWRYLALATQLMNDAWLELIRTGNAYNRLAGLAAVLGVIMDLNQFIDGLGALSTLANQLGLANGPCNLGGIFP